MTAGRPLIGIVAGEKSGDMLGAGLVNELIQHYPQARFIGIAGDAMLNAGVESLYPLERLSVMGLIEPLKRLPELIKIRHGLINKFIDMKLDLFIGIDSPDFNLGLARALKRNGITCCHYVCPSVWAWRQRRVKKIKQSIDHVLALLPFEVAFLQQHAIASTFVGHPLADELVVENSSEQIQPRESVNQIKSVRLCLMPGSRETEVDALLEVFLAAAAICLQRCPELTIDIAAATPAIQTKVNAALQRSANPLFKRAARVEPCFQTGQSQQLMRMADVILLASGTATLEAALLQKPMVVAYKMSPLGFALAKRLVQVDHVSLPNLLLQRDVVPELIQADANPPMLAKKLLDYIVDVEKATATSRNLAVIGDMLKQNANQRAAEAVVALLSKDGL